MIPVQGIIRFKVEVYTPKSHISIQNIISGIVRIYFGYAPGIYYHSFPELRSSPLYNSGASLDQFLSAGKRICLISLQGFCSEMVTRLRSLGSIHYAKLWLTSQSWVLDHDQLKSLRILGCLTQPRFLIRVWELKVRCQIVFSVTFPGVGWLR